MQVNTRSRVRAIIAGVLILLGLLYLSFYSGRKFEQAITVAGSDTSTSKTTTINNRKVEVPQLPVVAPEVRAADHQDTAYILRYIPRYTERIEYRDCLPFHFFDILRRDIDNGSDTISGIADAKQRKLFDLRVSRSPSFVFVHDTTIVIETKINTVIQKQETKPLIEINGHGRYHFSDKSVEAGADAKINIGDLSLTGNASYNLTRGPNLNAGFSARLFNY